MHYASILKVERFSKILKHLEKWSFLVNSKSKLDPFNFGPAGKLVFDNLRSEWIRSNVTNRNQQVFSVDTANTNLLGLNIKEGFAAARKLNPNLPFGLVDVPRSCSNSNKIASTDKSVSIIKPQISTVYRYINISSPSDSQQFFYQWQLERKRWWRLFSRDPGNFSLGTGTAKDGYESAQVLCQYPWAEFILETISYHGSSWFEELQTSDQNSFYIVNGRKRVFPHVVECLICGELAALLYMCDAFSDADRRPVLIFHRKVAPFKFSFALSSDCEDNRNDLLHMTKMVCLELRRRGISTLWPQESDKPLDKQFEQNDCLGVPFTVVVSLESLTNGIIKIRDRDTTLQEEIHITDIGEYGELLVKNYEIKNF